MLRKIFAVLALLAGSTTLANAAGDAKAGEAVFKRCAVCHTSDKGGGDGLGPNLFGVVGRKAATRPGFAYSAPLQKSGIVWNEANLTKWTAGPAKVVPGTKMAFAGISSKKQQADVTAYLASLK
jgi:cytochrome c